MSYPVEFLVDFATFKKGDTTNSISGDIVANLRNKGIVKNSTKETQEVKDIEVIEPKEVKPVIKKAVKKRSKK